MGGTPGLNGIGGQEDKEDESDKEHQVLEHLGGCLDLEEDTLNQDIGPL